ncbi:MAG: efflux transporter outer membrane subunit [Parachlamydiaceae bacterium]|nr:efflux transporter outer membrane subunit [Parachlamydiaceae bacterium]
MKRQIFCFLTTALISASCQLGPAYQTPEAPIPETWKAAVAEVPETDSKEPCQLKYWWEVFDDDALNQLEIEALNNNRDLYIAIERVIEARALAGVQRADLFPQVNLNPSYTESEMLIKFFLPPGFPETLAPNGIAPFRVHQYQYVLPLNFSYEIDLWGKLKGKYNSAVFSAEAQAEALCSTLLSVTTDIASNYFLMRSYDEQIILQQQLVEELQKAHRIATARYEKGIANTFEVMQSSIQLLGIESTLLDNLRLRRLQENRIAVLLGLPPSEFTLPSNPLSGEPPTIPAGLPASILTQRPDIREAERQNASEHALIGVAYASYLPSLQLTATVGFLSPDYKDFLKWISRLWILGANANQTIFDGGRNDENVDVSWSRFRQATNRYQQTVLTALREVEDALTNLELQAQQDKILSLQFQAAKSSANLSQSRYKSGLVNYIEVATALQSYIDTEINYVSLKTARFLSTVQLIKALGGSW